MDKNLDPTFREKLAKVRLVVTDVDGVHTNDKVTIFIASENERKVFGLESVGGTLLLTACDTQGIPQEKVQQFSTGLDGRIEGYTFFTPDGIAVKEAIRHEIPVVLISGRKSPAVRQRAMDIGARCLQGITDKVGAIEILLKELDLGWDEVLFIGNDIQDISLLRQAGFSAAPQDGAPEARAETHYVAQAKGGDGVVREVIQMMLEAKGLWKSIISRERTLG